MSNNVDCCDRVQVINEDSNYFGLVGKVDDIHYCGRDIITVVINGREKRFYRDELELVRKR